MAPFERTEIYPKNYKKTQDFKNSEKLNNNNLLELNPV
jgi:hypothetical protein